MGVIRFAIENPVKVAVGVILLVLFGFLSVWNIGIQLIPDVDRPIITVTTQWTGASPQEVEREIVDRQEEKLKSVSGLKKMTSTSSRDMAVVRLEFAVGVNKDVAYRDVSDKLRQVSNYPDQAEEPTLSTTDSDMEQTIAWMILYSRDGVDIADQKTFVEDHVKPILERAEGVSEVAVYGGREREMQVVIDASRLAARGLTFRDVEAALRRRNVNISAGTIAQGKLDYTYRAVGEYTNIGEIEDTVIAEGPGGSVYVRDVAHVVDGFKKPVSFVRSKGQPVLALPARRETGANVITAMENLRRQIELVNRDVLAPRGMGLELTQVYDETIYIWSSINLVLNNIWQGGLLTVIVLVLFLRSTSATGIITLSIPITLIGTLLVIVMAGRGLNVVLLAGLAFAVGMVVDNAIVVLENIYRHASMGKSKADAAFDGAKEVWGAVLASTLTTMAVFLPVITIQEEAGQLFADIAVAVSAAVFLSMVVSIIVVPTLASKYFEASRAKELGEKPWWLAERVGALVARINGGVMRRIVVFGGMTLASVAGSWLLMPGAEYLPSGNKNLVFGFLSSPPGYSLDEFRRMGEVVEDGAPDNDRDGIRRSWEAELGSPEAESLDPVPMTVGRGKGSIREVRPAPIRDFFYVSFDGGAFMGCTSKDPSRVRPMEKVLSRAGGVLPGVFTFFNQIPLFPSGNRAAGSLELEVRGNDLNAVVASASAITGKLMEAGYPFPFPDPQNYDLGRPETQLVPDHDKAADIGLNTADAGFILQACVDGAFVGEFNDRGDKIDLVLRVKDTDEASLTDIVNVPIHAPIGKVVSLGSAMTFTRTSAPQKIKRIEEMPAVSLSVKPRDGVPLQDTMEDIESHVIQPMRESGTIPSDVITALTGTADKLTQTRRALIGDFRGVVTRPRLFGLSVAVSIAVILGVAAAACGAVGVALGGRRAAWFAVALGGLFAMAFLAMNPRLALMVFESRAVLTVLITYLLMAALFESFAYPFIIMFSVPLAAVGGFGALRIVHEISLFNPSSPIQQLDVLTMLGFVILVGTVVNNAILIVHQSLNFMRDEGLDYKDAVVKSVRTRTRPIFMTAGTTIFGLIPLVVMPGAGSELYRGLGSVVLGGLLVSTMFTLVVVPAVFTLFLDFQRWLGAPAAKRAHEPRVHETDPHDGLADGHRRRERAGRAVPAPAGSSVTRAPAGVSPGTET